MANTMKRKNKISWLQYCVKTLPALVGVVAFIYVALLIKDFEMSTVMPISKVQVRGDMIFIDKNEIKSIVEDSISGGFFTVDLNRVRETLLQKPWVEKVALRRSWPDGVEVFVEERKPIAFWNADAYISDNGHVFKPEAIDKSLELPVLGGPDGQHNNVWKFMNVLYKEMDLLNYTVTSLGLDARRAWKLEIKSNATVGSESDSQTIDVRLGRFDTEKRLKRFIRVLPALASEKEFVDNKIKVIDMRYPNGFSVRMTTNEKVADKKSLVDRLTVTEQIKIQNVPHNFAYKKYLAPMRLSEA